MDALAVSADMAGGEVVSAAGGSTKGAAEVVRFAQFAKLGRQLAALAEAVAEAAPEAAERQRGEARLVQEQSIALASSGGLRVPSAAIVESVLQQGTSATLVSAEVARLSSAVLEVQKESAVNAAELKQIHADALERFRQQAARLEECVQWRQALDDLQKSQGEYTQTSIKLEAERLQATMLESKLLLEGKIEELKDRTNAAASEQASLHKESQKQHAAHDARFTEVNTMWRQAESALRAELDAIAERLTRGFEASERHLNSEKRTLEEAIVASTRTLAEKQSTDVADLHRYWKDLEHRFKAHRHEQEDAKGRLAKQIEAGRTAAEQQLDQRCEDLSQALQAQQRRATLGQEEVAANAKQYIDEIRTSLEASIAKAAARAEAGATASARGFSDVVREEASVHLNSLLPRFDHTDETFKDVFSRLDAVAKRGDDKLQTAIVDVVEQIARLKDGFNQEVEGIKCAAVQSSHELVQMHQQALVNHKRMQEAEVADQASELRAEIERGLAAVRVEIVDSSKELCAAMEVVAEEGKQAHSSNEVSFARISNIEAMQTKLLGEIAEQVRRIKQVDNRIDDKVSYVTDEFRRTLQEQAAKVGEVKGCLDTELRRLVKEAEGRLHNIVEQESSRIGEFQTALERLRVDLAVNAHQQAAAASAAQEAAERAHEEGCRASSHAASLEAPIKSCAVFLEHLREDEVKSLAGSLTDIHAALASITAGLMKIAQCCGFIGGLEDRPSDRVGSAAPTKHLMAEHVGVKQLLEWERSGTPLVTRIEKSWMARASAQASTLLELIQQKADAQTLHWVQGCMRDLDMRAVANRNATYCIPHCQELSGSSFVRTGAPFAGPFGGQAHRRNGGDAPSPPSGLHFQSKDWGDAPSPPSGLHFQSKDDPRHQASAAPTSASCASLLSSHHRSRSELTVTLQPSASIDQEGNHHAAVDASVDELVSHQPRPPVERPPVVSAFGEGPLQRRALSAR